MTECADDAFIQSTEDECWLWKTAEGSSKTNCPGKAKAGEICWRWMQSEDNKKPTREVMNAELTTATH